MLSWNVNILDSKINFIDYPKIFSAVTLNINENKTSNLWSKVCLKCLIIIEIDKCILQFKN